MSLQTSGVISILNIANEFGDAAPHMLDKPLSNILTDSVEVILNNQKAFNDANKEDKPYCMARREPTKQTLSKVTI